MKTIHPAFEWHQFTGPTPLLSTLWGGRVIVATRPGWVLVRMDGGFSTN